MFIGNACFTNFGDMLVYGTCNPEGYGDASYEGLYLTDSDIQAMVPQMQGIPVKVCFLTSSFLDLKFLTSS